MAFRIASVGFGVFGVLYLIGTLMKLRSLVKFFALLMLLCLGTCFVTIVGEFNPPMDPDEPVETLVLASVKQSWGWAVLLIACVLPLLPLESSPTKTSVEPAVTPQASKGTSAAAEALENLHNSS